jgi:hypothetical protein
VAEERTLEGKERSGLRMRLGKVSDAVAARGWAEGPEAKERTTFEVLEAVEALLVDVVGEIERSSDG